MGSFPWGACSPKRISTMAAAPSVPGIQTSRRAFDFAETSRRSSGRPEKRTVTTFSLTAVTASKSRFCTSGRSNIPLLAASPLWSRSSPTASTTISASLAAFTASSSIASSSSSVKFSFSLSSKPWSLKAVPSTEEPRLKVIFSSVSTFFRASSRFSTSFASAMKDQEPKRFRLFT